MSTGNTSESKSNTAPAFAIGAQYIKDLSFENNKVLSLLQSPPKSPQTAVQFHVSHTAQDSDRYEVDLRIVASLKSEKDTIYLLDITYTGLFMIRGLDKDTLTKVLAIECPRILYPSARSIVIGLTQDSGFPPMYMAPAVDFAGMHDEQQKAH